MPQLIPHNSLVKDLYRLTFLLTGSEESSVCILSEAFLAEGVCFSTSDASIRPRLLMTLLPRALAIEATPTAVSAVASVLSPGHCPHFQRLQQALLGMDRFSRSALLLTVFEGMSVQQVATLLDSDAASIRAARSDALGELSRAMAPWLHSKE